MRDVELMSGVMCFNCDEEFGCLPERVVGILRGERSFACAIVRWIVVRVEVS